MISHIGDLVEGLGLSLLPPEALVARLAAMTRAQGHELERHARQVCSRLALPDKLVEPVVEEARRQRSVHLRRPRPACRPRERSVEERLQRLARVSLGHPEDWAGLYADFLDVRIHPPLFLALAGILPGVFVRPRAALVYRVRGHNPESVSVPPAIRTVDACLAWICPCDLHELPDTPPRTAFRAWLLKRARRRRGAR